MPRAEPTIELTDAEKRVLIARTQVDKALAEKFRFMRLENKARSNESAATTTAIGIVGNDTMTMMPVIGG